MISGDNNSLIEVAAAPIPEWMFGIQLSAEIGNISGKHKNIACRDYRIFKKPIDIFLELQMQVGSVLDFHHSAAM
ncbi:hypothetical protein IMSAGC001_04024 [Bacteroides acidifaciens]|uniref:Uncharacterized protein n=1 Tax=Bacteroides acidifaciens TaxID=85831 RepID=A0A7J0A9G8_9BACE|nr:hypothetical protein IMSAGC001_04024 [Bacteroides acidifaciens]